MPVPMYTNRQVANSSASANLRETLSRMVAGLQGCAQQVGPGQHQCARSFWRMCGSGVQVGGPLSRGGKRHHKPVSVTAAGAHDGCCTVVAVCGQGYRGIACQMDCLMIQR